MEDFDVPFEIRIKHREIVDRYFEDGSLLHDGIAVVTEFLSRHHHVIHCGTHFSTDSVCGFLPLPTGFGHQIAPTTKCFGVCADDPVGTGHEDGMKDTTSAVLFGTGNFSGAYFEAWIETAVGGNGF